MARFNLNDKIEFQKFGKAIRKGVVVGGPFNVDKIDHYHVKWEWDEDGNTQWKNMNCDLICDLASTKYSYQLSN